MLERIKRRDLEGDAASLVFGAIALAYLLLCAVINFRGFTVFATPDMYSDTLIAKLMWEQKTIFPEGWVFGNQFYVFSTPVLAAGFYGITGGLNFSMALATETMTALILVSFWWMAKPYCSRAALFAGLLGIISVMVCPSAPDHLSGQLFYLMCSYYAGYLITLFVVCGAYMRLRTDSERALLTPSAIVSLLLSFAMGMQSIRQTAVMVLPLICVEAWRYIRDRRFTRSTYFTIGVTAANLLGLAAIRLMHVPNVSIYGSFSATGSTIWENISEGWRCLLAIVGLRNSEGAGAAVVVYAVLLIACVASLPFHSRKKPLAMAAGTCALGIAASLAANMVIDLSMRSIYLFTWFPLAAIALVCLIDALKKFPWARAAVCLVFAVFSAMNLYSCYWPSVLKTLHGDDVVELAAAEFIVENDYDYLYAEWYYGSRVAVRTDGAVVAGTWHDNCCEVLGYINPQNIYSEADNSRAVYMVADAERDELYGRAAEVGAELTCVADFPGGLELYESTRQLMYLP